MRIVHSRFGTRFATNLALATLLLTSTVAFGDTTADLIRTASQRGDASYSAIDALGESTDTAAAVPALIKGLSSKDAGQRWRSARALGEIGPAAVKATSALVKSLADSDRSVKIHAAVALGKLGDRSESTVNALVAAATDSEGQVSRAAINSVRRLKLPPARLADALEEVLKSKQYVAMIYAVESAVELGTGATPVLNELLTHENGAYWACIAIEEIGPDADGTADALKNLVDTTQDTATRMQGVLALAAIGKAGVIAAPEFMSLLKSDDQATVRAAAYAIGATGASQASDALEGLAETKDPFLHMIVAWSLAKIHPESAQQIEKAVKLLTAGLGSEDVMVRTVAAKGLHQLKAPPEIVIPALVELIDDPNPTVAANAVEALASLGEDVAPQVGNALGNEQLRDVAVHVLHRLGPKGAAAVPNMVACLRDNSDPDFCQAVHAALAAVGPEAADATGVLVTALSSDNKDLRHSAVYALGKIGPLANKASDALQKLLSSDNEFDRIASAWALLRIAPEDPSIAKSVIPVVIEGLQMEDELVRLECVIALGTAGAAARSATGALEEIAENDPSESVREAAVAALDSIK